MKFDKFFILSLGLFIFQTQIFAATSALVELNLSSKKDYAGVWGQFQPGTGNMNSNPADWEWQLKLNLAQAAKIHSITVLHNLPGEGWSTSSESFFNKSLYPIVVFHNGSQINTAYDQSLGVYPPGEHVFSLYAQKESTPFVGAKVFIEFEDGTLIKATIESAGFGPESMPLCKESVVFDLGREWTVQEGIWTGHWVRRGESRVFDATWEVLGNFGAYSGKKTTDVIELTKIDGYQVHLYRKGTQGYYHGILSCDKKSITNGIGDWFANGDKWIGVISTGEELAHSTKNLGEYEAQQRSL